jgi:4a-hydroxytetrahydrobiopterin dehydratase
MLPHSDPDFKTPMEGLTRSAYDNVQSALRRYRERWLGLMDVWEKAEERIGKETFLGTAEAEEAIKLLDSAEARPPLADVAGECSAPLDALEQAHEKARELAATLQTNVSTTTQRIDALAKRGRSNAAFQGPMAEVARGVELAKQGLEPDPVAARGRLEEIATRLEGAVARLDELEAVDDRRAKAVVQVDEVSQKVRAKRAEGWLLAEPGANPDELIVSSQNDCALAAQLLDAGEVAACLAELPAWSLSPDGAFIRREWTLADFRGAIKLANNIGALAERERHHPDLHLESYRRLRVELTTHAIGGLSINDFRLAAKIDAIAPA